MTPIVLDLCCGKGGWAEGFLAAGWNVLGIDIKFFPEYPAGMIVRDLTHVRGADYAGCISAVVASPPCQEFSRWDAPGLFERGKPPSLHLVNRCFEIAEAAGVPIVLENVRGLQDFLGPAVQHYHSFYMWGNGVSPLKPYAPGRAGRPVLKWQHRSAALRAKIPFELAYHVASFLRNMIAESPSGGSDVGKIDHSLCQDVDNTYPAGTARLCHSIDNDPRPSLGPSLGGTGHARCVPVEAF